MYIELIPFVLYHRNMFLQPVQKVKFESAFQDCLEQILWSRGDLSFAFLGCQFRHFLSPFFTGSHEAGYMSLIIKELVNLSVFQEGFSWTELKVRTIFKQSNDSLELDFMRWRWEIWRQGTSPPTRIGSLWGNGSCVCKSSLCLWGPRLWKERPPSPVLDSWTKQAGLDHRKSFKLHGRHVENRKDNFIWLLFSSVISSKRFSITISFKNG